MMVIMIKNWRNKKCVISLKFNDFKNFFFKNEIILKSKIRFKSEAHTVYAEKINKIALSSKDDKSLQIFDGITSYPYGKNSRKVCKIEYVKNM